jgi:hypothetical protein
MVAANPNRITAGRVIRRGTKRVNRSRRNRLTNRSHHGVTSQLTPQLNNSPNPRPRNWRSRAGEFPLKNNKKLHSAVGHLRFRRTIAEKALP